MFFDADSSNLKDKIAKDTSIVKGIFNTPFSTTISLSKTPWRTSSTFSKPNIAIIGMAYYKQYLVEKSFRKVFRVYLFSTKREMVLTWTFLGLTQQRQFQLQRLIYVAGLALVDILERRSSSNTSTWQMFYKNDIILITTRYSQKRFFSKQQKTCN